jgi:sugar lactone lactonase YvrE
VRRLPLAALVALALIAVPAHARDRWDTKVHALVPTPGFPAHAYVAPNGRVYEGTYTNPNGDTVPSRVFEYDGDGTLLRSWTVRGQRLDQPHGVQVATSDGAGRLVLLDKSPPRALLLDRRTGDQSEYAAFDEGVIPNYGAWGPDGSLYVTDYAQPVLWRIPPGGGKPVEWLRDARLDGEEFGTTGLELGTDGRTLLVAVQSQAGSGPTALNPSTGRLFTIALQPDGSPGPLTQLWESRPADGPDGFGIARSGAIYMSLLATNQLAVIEPNGTERERFPALPGGGDNGSPVPFDGPSNVSFLGTRVMVANQAYFSGDRTRHAILDVETGEEGHPELIPPAPRVDTPPVTTPKAKPRWSCRRYRTAKKRRACRRTLARRAAARRKAAG